MIKKMIYALVIVLSLTFFACSDENPSDIFVNPPNNESSSSIFVESSSSEEFGLSSSSFDIFSSSSEISSSTWAPYSYGELIDERDGQVYKTIKIGEQTWMAENLNFAYALPTSKKDSSHTNNKPESRDKYGKLYRWSIAMDSAAVFSLDGKGCGDEVNCGSQPSKGVRGVCPENWHIPNETDIKNIIDYSKESNDKLIWLEHYWFLTENEDNEFKTEMELQYNSFWTSEQLDKDYAKGLYFKIYKTSTNSTPKPVAYPVRCVKDDKIFQIEHGTMTDERDGQVYKTVKIGNQWWMAENLNYELPEQEFNAFESTLSLCYNNEPDSCAKYGRLYTFAAATHCCPISPIYINSDSYNPRGICPENWHIPSVNEWKTLLNFVNGFATDLKSTNGWFDDGNGYDILDFRLLPAGYYRNYEILEEMGFDYEVPKFDNDSKKIEFISIGQKACFWTPKHSTRASFYGDVYQLENAFSFCFSNDKNEASFSMEYKIYAYSVRCVKDSMESK